MPTVVRRRRLLALGLACALALSRGAHAQEIEVRALRHRNAAELLPLFRPFVEPGGALTGQGFQLILRASQINTGQGGHLDASMVEHALAHLAPADDSVLFIENVGKTSLARTLLGADVGEGRDAPHVTDLAEPQVLLSTPAGVALRLWDTRGFGDSAR
ncbi:MAG: hypothetical protein ACK5T1_09240, partial [Betaproteobacteria bacterium]